MAGWSRSSGGRSGGVHCRWPFPRTQARADLGFLGIDLTPPCMKGKGSDAFARLSSRRELRLSILSILARACMTSHHLPPPLIALPSLPIICRAAGRCTPLARSPPVPRSAGPRQKPPILATRAPPTPALLSRAVPPSRPTSWVCRPAGCPGSRSGGNAGMRLGRRRSPDPGLVPRAACCALSNKVSLAAKACGPQHAAVASRPQFIQRCLRCSSQRSMRCGGRHGGSILRRSPATRRRASLASGLSLPRGVARRTRRWTTLRGAGCGPCSHGTVGLRWHCGARHVALRFALSGRPQRSLPERPVLPSAAVRQARTRFDSQAVSTAAEQRVRLRGVP